MKKKKEEVWVAPSSCPLMRRCEEEVAWETFEEICNSESWIFCENAIKAAKKYKRKPYEWKLVHELGGFPENTFTHLLKTRKKK